MPVNWRLQFFVNNENYCNMMKNLIGSIFAKGLPQSFPPDQKRESQKDLIGLIISWVRVVALSSLQQLQCNGFRISEYACYCAQPQGRALFGFCVCQADNCVASNFAPYFVQINARKCIIVCDSVLWMPSMSWSGHHRRLMPTLEPNISTDSMLHSLPGCSHLVG